MEYKVLVGIGLLAGIMILYKLLHKDNNNFDREINDILTSDKYKVKGQYEDK